MDFFGSFPRKLLNETQKNERAYKAFNETEGDAEQDADFFFEMTKSAFAARTALYERNRANHIMLKATIESVP